MNNKIIYISILSIFLSILITGIVYLLNPFSFKIFYNDKYITKESYLKDLSTCNKKLYPFIISNNFNHENILDGHIYRISKDKYNKNLTNHNLEIKKFEKNITFLSLMYTNSQFIDIFYTLNIWLHLKHHHLERITYYEKRIIKILHDTYPKTFKKFLPYHPHARILYPENLIEKILFKTHNGQLLPYNPEYISYMKLFEILCIEDLQILELRNNNYALLISYFLSLFILIYILLNDLSSNKFKKIIKANGK